MASAQLPSRASATGAVRPSIRAISHLTTPQTAVVAALSTTPVKGLRIQRREAIELDAGGVRENRRFYLVDDRARMVNGKQLGILSAVVASFDSKRRELALSFPDGETVVAPVALSDWLDTRFFSREYRAQLVDGPFSEALSQYAGRSLRLVHADPATGRGIDRGIKGAVSLVGSASVAQLAQVAGRDVDSRRFRMLVEVDGLAAHAEDAWVGRDVRIGSALVRMNGHVGRCLVTGQDPERGVADLPTLDLLRSYRAGIPTTEPLACGIYGEVLEPGEVRLGDAVLLVG
ncbi:MAG: MOSC N-terminal beta barrel domain-containing protein [Solirubrobacteraceae bacterium]|jgi:uncharacterized protein YcbX